MRRYFRWRMSRPQVEFYWDEFSDGTRSFNRPAWDKDMQNWRGRKPGRRKH